MNETLQQILTACVPVLCLLITAGGAYMVALLRRETAQLEKEIDNETVSKYMDMAVDAVAFTAQTFVDSLKAEGKFTKEKQLEAFQKAKDKALEILGDTVVKALNEVYGDFDAWIETKIEQACRADKAPTAKQAADTAATTAAATAASVATTIATTAVQQIAAEAPTQGAEVSATAENAGNDTGTTTE